MNDIGIKFNDQLYISLNILSLINTHLMYPNVFLEVINSVFLILCSWSAYVRVGGE